jgi:cobalt-zinc-cadmium efflux system protein
VNSHHHGIDRHHHGSGTTTRRALLFAVVANGILLAAQVVVGLTTGSLAVLADSLHNASDVVALVVALVAQTLAARPATRRNTSGLARAEVLGALLNGAVLLALTGWVVVEAVGRFGDPRTVDPGPVAAIGVVGLVVNASSAWYLTRTGDRSVNVRAAFWHLTGDALGSFGVVVAAAAIAWFDLEWADPVASLLISALVIVGVLQLLRDTIAVLLESAPVGIDADSVAAYLDRLEGVRSVHHLHVWAIDSTTAALTAHLELEPDTDLHTAQEIADRARHLVAERFGIDHATFEPECHECDTPEHLPVGAEPQRATGP